MKNLKRSKRDIRVIVCGDRYWTDPIPIIREIYKPEDRPRLQAIIEGGAMGADTIASILAEVLKSEGYKIQHLTYLPEWGKFNKAAGPIRNRRQLKEGRANLVLAFHKDIAKSKGTADMLQVAKDNKIKWKLFDK